MNKSLLLGALCASTFGFVCAPAMAQPLPPQNMPMGEEDEVEKVKAKTGYELFLEARALAKDGPNGDSITGAKSTPAENLRLQRLGTARNAPALAKLREAMKSYIVFPGALQANFEDGAAVRNFARDLAQESDVRAADGDAVAATQSSLDALELSTQVARGPIIQALVGAVTQAIARKSLESHAGDLNAAQLRAVADKWEKTSGYFPTYAHTLRDEEQSQGDSLYRSFGAQIAKWNDPVAVAEAENGFKTARETGTMTPAQLKQAEETLKRVKGVTYANVVAQSRAIFDEALSRANQPYAVAALAPPIQTANPVLVGATQLISAPRTRFYAERNAVENRQLIAAMRLRAAKLETGAYPATFAAPADPFSPTLSPMIYQRAGDAYVLYSVGPDGVDNDGAEIQTIAIDSKTGVKTVSERLGSESIGDIAAPVL